MMDWTDRHCRYFMRCLNHHVGLYTEMVATGALLHGEPDRWLRMDKREHPVAVQLGGNEPDDLARCAEMAVAWGYDEINLNVGCPSDRVQSGRFGACLMTQPALVASSVAAMAAAADVPITVKNRLGLDGHEEYDFTRKFVETVAEAGCRTFIVHARIAVLEGLSPKENRSVPPLRYDDVYRLKSDFPELRILLNGGIRDVSSAARHLAHVDGVMIGRQAYNDPWFLRDLLALSGSGEDDPSCREQVVREMICYAESAVAQGHSLWQVVRHMLGLYNGVPGARRWRRFLAESCRDRGAGPEILERSLEIVSQDA